MTKIPDIDQTTIYFLNFVNLGSIKNDPVPLCLQKMISMIDLLLPLFLKLRLRISLRIIQLVVLVPADNYPS